MNCARMKWCRKKRWRNSKTLLDALKKQPSDQWFRHESLEASDNLQNATRSIPRGVAARISKRRWVRWRRHGRWKAVNCRRWASH